MSMEVLTALTIYTTVVSTLCVGEIWISGICKRIFQLRESAGTVPYRTDKEVSKWLKVIPVDGKYIMTETVGGILTTMFR